MRHHGSRLPVGGVAITVSSGAEMRVDTSLHAIAGFSVQDQACRAREASLGSGRLSGAAKVPGVVNVATRVRLTTCCCRTRSL